jgi:uncharacterized protein (DUF4213/DUF364 family)
MPLNEILTEVADECAAILGPDFGNVVVTRGVVGLYFTGVSLSTGTAGVCATPPPREMHPACCPGLEDVIPPGTLRGRTARSLLEELASPYPLRRAVGLATLNALAEACLRRCSDPGAELRCGVDAFDAAAIAPGQAVVLVGAFIPFLRALKRMGQDYTVLERSPAMLKPDELPHFRPAEEADAVIPHGEVVLMTGSTLLAGALEHLLAVTRPDARVVVVGPTATLWAGPYFRRGVDVLGGIRVTAPERFLDMLAEGAGGHHLFGSAAQPVVLLRREGKSGTVLAA